MATHQPDEVGVGDTADVLIVGGSVAATRAAEAVVRHAPQLNVVVVSDEAHAPYERPPLSKIGLGDEVALDKLTYPMVAALTEAGVQLRYGTRAESLDTESRIVTTSDGPIRYRRLVIATGCDPVVPPLFADAPDVYTLRRFEDAVRLRTAVDDPDTAVAIVGAGFIGGEFAATLRKEGRRVALVDLATQPLGRLGGQVAEAYEKLHRDHGVALELGRGAIEFANDPETGRRLLVLDDGRRIDADVVLVGVGVRPAVGWLEGSSVQVANGVVCDAFLRAEPEVFAAGDIVTWRNERYGTEMRVEHWTAAAEQGRVAGINAAKSLLGEDLVPCSIVPYFWSDQHGVRIQFAGRRSGVEDVVELHDESGSLYLYRDGEEVTAVAAFEQRRQFVKLRAALRTGLTWDKARQLLQPAPAAT